jgi:hypothetical protein
MNDFSRTVLRVVATPAVIVIVLLMAQAGNQAERDAQESRETPAPAAPAATPLPCTVIWHHNGKSGWYLTTCLPGSAPGSTTYQWD